MANEKNVFNIKDGVFISTDVIAVICGLSATETEGVVSLSNGLSNQEIEKASMSRLARSIRLIEHPDRSLTVRLSLQIAYGSAIPEVTANVQQKVKSTVENMTGIDVKEVDIRIASIGLQNQEKAKAT